MCDAIMSENKKPIFEKFQSIEEIQDFWDNHSTADYWDEMADVDFELSAELKSRIELKKLYGILELSDQQIADIESKAGQQKTDSKALLRTWILEHV